MPILSIDGEEILMDRMPPEGMVRVSERQYAEFAKSIGLLPLGMHMMIKDKYVGWRTNKYVYVDPHVFKQFLGRYPFNYRA
jgi:hypothetical protein